MCEQVAHEGRIFDDDEALMNEVHNFEEAKAFVTKENAVTIVEERVRIWIKRLKDFMVESKQVKRENDNSGPQQELEYWKRRGAQFSQLVNKLQVCTCIPMSHFHQTQQPKTLFMLTCKYSGSRNTNVASLLASCTLEVDKRLGRRGG